MKGAVPRHMRGRGSTEMQEHSPMAPMDTDSLPNRRRLKRQAQNESDEKVDQAVKAMQDMQEALLRSNQELTAQIGNLTMHVSNHQQQLQAIQLAANGGFQMVPQSPQQTETEDQEHRENYT